MFTKLTTLRTIEESGAVLIIRLPDADSAERVAHAAVDGGFRALEITLSIPGAVDLIRRLAAQYTSRGVGRPKLVGRWGGGFGVIRAIVGVGGTPCPGRGACRGRAR